METRVVQAAGQILGQHRLERPIETSRIRFLIRVLDMMLGLFLFAVAPTLFWTVIAVSAADFLAVSLNTAFVTCFAGLLFLLLSCFWALINSAESDGKSGGEQ
jgi:hypothetical protein